MEPDTLRDDIAQARKGDREALDRVLTAMQSRLRAAAAHRIGTPLRAKMATSDLLQSTYVDVVRSIGSFEGDDPDTFVAWTTRIMENNLRDRLRFYNRKRRDGEVSDADAPDAAADTPTPSIRAMQVENLTAVSRLLSELPEDQQQIIKLRVFEEREYDEIAEILGRTPQAVRMLLSRARAALTVRLDRHLADEE